MPHPHPNRFPPGSGTTQRRTPTDCSKPNLKVLVSKKGRSICRKQNLVRESPERPCRKGAFRKRLGNGFLEVGRRLEQWHPKAPRQGSRARRGGRGVGARAGMGKRLMHRLLGAVHEAAVQLSKLPIGDVPAALFQVLHDTEQNCQSGSLEGGAGLPCLPCQ